MNHLTLEAFAAYADGTPPGTAAEAHLAVCAECRAEARAWNAVARGVRLLEAGYAPPPLVIDGVLAAVDQLPSRSPWRRRRVALVSVAAAVVLGVAGYGLDSMLGSSGRPAAGGVAPTSAAELAAALTPTECKRLEVAAGTLVSVSGSRMVLRTSAGKLITVTASDSTRITRQVAGSLRDVRNGVQVFVDGTGSASGATVAAQRIAVLPKPANEPKTPPRVAGLPDPDKALAQSGHANGTVTGAGSGGFTVVEPSGHRVRVTTSSATRVIEQVNATLGQLQKGKFTVAVGTPQSDGTLAAVSIQQNTLAGDPGGVGHVSVKPPLRGPGGLPSGLPKLGSAPPPKPKGPFSGLGCDSGAIATTAMLRAGS
jgi:hypothetical protein